MQPLLRSAALAALFTLLPLHAYAQSHPAFNRPFQYTDREGTGTLTIAPVFDVGTGVGFQRIRVTLEQGSRRFTGAGVYSATEQGTSILPPPVLLAFTLLDSVGRSYFFEGSVSPSGEGYAGQGTYFPVTSPQTTLAWRVQSQGGGTPGPEPIVSSRPTLRGGWTQNTFSEAIGGVYFATFNTQSNVASTATWSGTLPAAGQYKVEVFIPRQRQGFTPRTNRATYRLGSADPQSQALPRIDQNVATSQWVELGTFTFGTSFEVVLTDVTGEPSFTRSVVANALRLTPITGAGGGTTGNGGL
jgi:hypothetical protein